MKSLPKLSILALCYNHAAFLEEALRSIAQLSYPNLEVLVIDDASTDGSVGILQKWQELQPAWSFFFQKQHQVAVY